MRRIVKGMAMVITLNFLLVTIFAGCGRTQLERADGDETVLPGASDASKPDISEEITLRMYLLGDKSKDFDLVYEQLNKMLKEDINATVDVRFMGWGEYMQKYPLVFASGDNFDLIYTANWCYYNSQATKGGFMEITRDMLEKYAPMTADTIYEDAWEQAKINGKVYMLPMNYTELNAYVYVVRGDLMDKYGITAIKNQDDFEKYLDAVAKNEKDLIPLDIGSDMDFDVILRFEVLAPLNLDILEPQQLNHYFKLDAKDSAKIVNIIETPEFLEYAKKMKKWREKGFWSKSALVNRITAKESFINGRSASAIVNLYTASGIYSSVAAAHPEWDVRVYDGMNGGGIAIKPYIQNGMGINAKSRHPERALMFLDLVRNDEEYADLVTYGIQGIHYEKTNNGKIKLLASTANYPVDNNCNWGWRNDRFFKQIEGGLPNYNEILNEWKKAAYTHPVQSFTFDDTSVKDEVESVTGLWKTEYKVIVLGFTENPEEEVKKLIQTYRNEGNDKIIQEQQRQIDKFLKNYNRIS